jgi:dipeptide/tripeptide permease
MCLGILFSAVAFVLSALVQNVIDSRGEEDRISILWQVPQYIIVTAGEIMFSITGLEFAYSQAPESMKSVVQAVWLFCVAGGKNKHHSSRNTIDVDTLQSCEIILWK